MTNIFFEAKLDNAGNIEVSGLVEDKSFRGLIHPKVFELIIDGLVSSLMKRMTFSGKMVSQAATLANQLIAAREAGSSKKAS